MNLRYVYHVYYMTEGNLYGDCTVYRAHKMNTEDESMIRFVGTDTNGEVALVTAEKSNEGKYEVSGSFDIPIFGMNNDDD